MEGRFTAAGWMRRVGEEILQNNFQNNHLYWDSFTGLAHLDWVWTARNFTLQVVVVFLLLLFLINEARECARLSRPT